MDDLILYDIVEELTTEVEKETLYNETIEGREGCDY